MTAPDRPLSAERRAAILAMLAAITGGWFLDRPRVIGGSEYDDEGLVEYWVMDDRADVICFSRLGDDEPKTAMQFIAAAPTIVRELLDAHDAAVARANAAESAMRAMADDAETAANLIEPILRRTRVKGDAE